MPYWTGFRVPDGARHIVLESFENYDEAKNNYYRVKETLQPKEIITPPFFAENEDAAREKAKIYMPD